MTTAETELTVDTYIGWLTVMLAFSLPVYRPWVSLSATLILALWLFGKGFRRRLSCLSRHRLTLAVVIFIALNILSLLWSSDPGSGLRYLSKYRYLLLIPMIASSVRPEFRRRAETAFIAGATISVALSYGVLAGILRLGDAHPGNPSHAMSHLDYSIVLALASLLILNRIVCAPMTTNRRLAWLVCFLFVASGLMINIGRSGQFAVGGTLVVATIYWTRKKSGSAAVTAGAVVAIFLTLMLLITTVPRFHKRADESRKELHAALVEHRYNSNLGGRIAAVIVSRDIFRANPVFGTGVGGNMPAFRQLLDTSLQELKPAIYWYPHLHNQYLQVATELGLFGLLALGWIFWELVKGPYRKLETQSDAIILGCVFLLGFFGDPYLHKQMPLVAFALIAGLISAQQLSERRKQLR